MTELGRMPMPGKDGTMKLGHAELQLGDSRLFLADAFSDAGWRAFSQIISGFAMGASSIAQFARVGGGI